MCVYMKVRGKGTGEVDLENPYYMRLIISNRAFSL